MLGSIDNLMFEQTIVASLSKLRRTAKSNGSPTFESVLPYSVEFYITSIFIKDSYLRWPKLMHITTKLNAKYRETTKERSYSHMGIYCFEVKWKIPVSSFRIDIFYNKILM